MHMQIVPQSALAPFVSLLAQNRQQVVAELVNGMNSFGQIRKCFPECFPDFVLTVFNDRGIESGGMAGSSFLFISVTIYICNHVRCASIFLE